MKNCDVCGNPSLIPKRIGSIYICVPCFLKANGPLWKFNHDRYEDAEKARCLALEDANLHNFPKHVVYQINHCFIEHIHQLVPCDCCGHPVYKRISLTTSNICRRCYNLINTPAWRQNEYDDNESVEHNRQKLTEIAYRHSFSLQIINEINQHFDSKIQKDLVCVLTNQYGQKLKVYTNHSVIITSSSFDYDTLSSQYGEACYKKTLTASDVLDTTVECVLISGIHKPNFTKGLASGIIGSVTKNGLIQAGVLLACDLLSGNSLDFKKLSGTFEISYQLYNQVVFQKDTEKHIGFIRFINRKHHKKRTEDVVFFFNNEPKINIALETIRKGIESTE